MYQIINTTDGKFIGYKVQEPIEIMKTLYLEDFVFKPLNATINGDMIVLSNPNYIIELNKEE